MGIISLFGAGMALQFERHGDGFVYRANGTGPALPVTEPEIDRFIQRGGVNFLLHTATFFLAVIAAALVTTIWFPKGDEAGGMVLMGVLLVAIGWLLYRSLRWSMFAPARALADRAPVAPERPASERPRARFQGHKKQRTPPPKPVRRGHWLLVIPFVIGELVGAFAAAMLGYWVLTGLGETVAIIGGLLSGVVALYVIDRWCKRVTGYSPAEFFSVISRLFD